MTAHQERIAPPNEPESVDRRRWRAVIAAGIGNTLEWYDFGVYAFMVPYISTLFFPDSSPATGILLALAVYGSGFVARPLGSILFGVYGDRAGRGRALAAVILIMAVSTGGIGLLPTYAAAGAVAPMLLVVLRLLQGLSAGGEWGGSASYMVEFARPGRRGFVGSWQQASLGLGSVLAAGLVATLANTLSNAEMVAWGWRIPFLMGFLVGIVGIILRWRIGDTPLFTKAVAESAVTRTPLRHALTKKGLRATRRAFGLSVYQAVASYLVLGYLPTFFVVVVGLPAKQALLVVTLGLALFSICAPITGWLSDRFGRKPLLIGSCVTMGVVAYPLLAFVDPTMGSALLVDFALVLAFTLFSGPSPAAYVELFPTSIRYTGLSVGYNFANAVFGGFAPFIAQLLVQRTGSNAAPAFYLVAAALVTLVVLIRIKETAFEPLT